MNGMDPNKLDRIVPDARRAAAKRESATGSRRSRSTHGSVRCAREFTRNEPSRNDGSSPGSTITTITRRMAVTGNCYAFTAMTTNTSGNWNGEFTQCDARHGAPPQLVVLAVGCAECRASDPVSGSPAPDYAVFA